MSADSQTSLEDNTLENEINLYVRLRKNVKTVILIGASVMCLL